MRITLEVGDKVILLPYEELLEVFRNRNFFTDDNTRIEYAKRLADASGTVSKVEEKYVFDYFFFLPDTRFEPANNTSYSIPYQGVDLKQFVK